MSEELFLFKARSVPVQRLDWPQARDKGLEVFIRRDDLLDHAYGGNKFYKLFYNLRAAEAAGQQQLLSFGGPYSNHLYALAAVGKEFGIKTIGVVRGERPAQLSPTLADAEGWGMQLCFVERSVYRAPELLDDRLRTQFGDFFAIPEGGANAQGVLGTKMLGKTILAQGGGYTSVCVASGTGGTLAGLSLGLGDSSRALGFSVLKGDGDLGAGIFRQQLPLGQRSDNWSLFSGFHGGGYGKKLPDYLRRFWQEFELETGVLLDPVYTVKMCWGVARLMALDYWRRGSRLLLIHTGGLQGRRGFNVECVGLESRKMLSSEGITYATAKKYEANAR